MIEYRVVKNQQFLFLAEAVSGGKYTTYKYPVSVTPGNVTKIEILFKDLVPYDKWQGPFVLKNVGDITFRTTQAPLHNASIEIFGLEFIK